MYKPFLGFGLAAFFLGWNAPNHYPPWTSFHLELCAALGLVLLGLGVFADSLGLGHPIAAAPNVPRRGGVVVPMPIAARVWFCLSVVPLLQHLMGSVTFRGDALLGLLYGAGTALGLYIGLLWAARQGREPVLRLLWLTLVIGGLAANGLALVQWLRLGTPGWWAMELVEDRPFGSLAQANHFGLLMVMSVIAVTALFETGAIRHRWVHTVATAFFGWGVLICQSRASILALICVAALWLLTRGRVVTRLRRLDIVLALLAVLVLHAWMQPLQEALRLTASQGRGMAEVGPRQWIWLHFWAAILERPWLGYGFNQGVAALAEVAAKVHPSRSTLYAHNLLLDLMTWVGIPLAMAMFAALCVWMLRWLRRIGDVSLLAQRHSVCAIWLALLVQSMLEFPYAHTYFLLPAALLAGAVSDFPKGVATLAGGSTANRASVWALALAAGSIALLGVTAWDYLRLEDDFRFARFERANFSNHPDHQWLNNPWVLDQLGVLNTSSRFRISAGMPAAQVEQLHQLARRFNMLSVRMDYAKAQALNGRLDLAEQELLVIRSAYLPFEYQSTERYWRQWLATNRAVIGQPKPASAR